ncbi:MAG: hypothetical protein CMQ28_05360 [Gammaproteobacteria bacterium]|nr:hypothetical protein [Gammaproteobacteria bacterium]
MHCDVPVLRRAAMNYLARREHSTFELHEKLLKKYPKLAIKELDLALNQLQKENLLSDERFTESYIRYRKGKGFGYKHIKAELGARRVDPIIIAKYLFIDDDDWEKIALDLVSKKVRYQDQTQYGSKLHQKIIRFMESRGFTVHEIKKALNQRMTFCKTTEK